MSELQDGYACNQDVRQPETSNARDGSARSAVRDVRQTSEGAEVRAVRPASVGTARGNWRSTKGGRTPVARVVIVERSEPTWSAGDALDF
jgi:hypothetical protein